MAVKILGLGLMGAAALLLVSCGPAPGPVISHHPDGYPDVQASAPGKATCVATSAAENARAAAFTSSTRRAKGLSPLRANDTLARAAAKHACDMAQREMMSHVGTSTKGPSQRVKALGYAPRITAENIAAGPFSHDRVLREWSSSNGHLANIMIPQLREVGIGHAIAADGRTVFWAAVYAQPK